MGLIYPRNCKFEQVTGLILIAVYVMNNKYLQQSTKNIVMWKKGKNKVYANYMKGALKKVLLNLLYIIKGKV